MTTYLGKNCSFGLLRVPFVNCRKIYVFNYFPFGFEGRMWDLIVSVPVHCLSFYLPLRLEIIARRGHLPISMVLKSEASLISEMLSLARTSMYVGNINVLNINKTEKES